MRSKRPNKSRRRYLWQIKIHSSRRATAIFRRILNSQLMYNSQSPFKSLLTEATGILIDGPLHHNGSRRMVRHSFPYLLSTSRAVWNVRDACKTGYNSQDVVMAVGDALDTRWMQGCSIPSDDRFPVICLRTGNLKGLIQLEMLKKQRRHFVYIAIPGWFFFRIFKSKKVNAQFFSSAGKVLPPELPAIHTHVFWKNSAPARNVVAALHSWGSFAAACWKLSFFCEFSSMDIIAEISVLSHFIWNLCRRSREHKKKKPHKWCFIGLPGWPLDADKKDLWWWEPDSCLPDFPEKICHLTFLYEK